MALPTVVGSLGVSPPVYVRKIDALGDWGASHDERGPRIQRAVQKIFLARHKSPFSFYLANNDTEMRRIMVALNENRRPQLQKLFLLAFLPDEVEAAGITAEITDGRTRCPFARGLHRDLTAQPNQIAMLCELAMNAERKPALYPSSPMIDEVFQASRDEMCLASVPDSPACNVAECSAHA